jgi:branched-chain amino acid transport system substrate-binding protein
MRHIPLLALSAALAASWSGAARAADVPGVTASAIKIGMFAPLTGPVAVAAKAAFGAAAVYQDVNQHGGVNGRQIEIIMEDDACDPNKGIAAVKKLIAQDQVFMIHGGWCSNVVLATKPEFTRDPSLPYMVLGAASASISTPLEKNIFQPVATTSTVARTMVEFALTKPGAQRIAIISHSDEWGKSQLEPSLAELKRRGLEPVETVYFERGNSDATSQSLKVRAAKPDVVLAILYPAELAIYLRDAYKYGIKVPTIGTQGVSIEDTEKRVGNAAAVRDLYVFYPLSRSLDAPEFKPWIDLFKAHYPKETVDTTSFISMGGSLAIVEDLKRLGGDVTRERFLGELERIQGFDPGVQASPLTFSAENHAGISSGAMIHLSDGKPVVVSRFPAANN